jgi:hypothetical protein
MRADFDLKMGLFGETSGDSISALSQSNPNARDTRSLTSETSWLTPADSAAAARLLRQVERPILNVMHIRPQRRAELLRHAGIPTVVMQLWPGARLAWGMVPGELRVRSVDLAWARSVLGRDT